MTCLAPLLAGDGGDVLPDGPRLFLAVVRVADLDDIARPGEFSGCDGADLPAVVRYARAVRQRATDCPPLADADRWPDPKVSWAAWERCRAARCGFEARIPWEADRAGGLLAWAEYAGWCTRCWDEAWYAACETQPIWRRRAGLRWLKENLPAGMYAAGELPEVP